MACGGIDGDDGSLGFPNRGGLGLWLRDRGASWEILVWGGAVTGLAGIGGVASVERSGGGSNCVITRRFDRSRSREFPLDVELLRCVLVQSKRGAFRVALPR